MGWGVSSAGGRHASRSRQSAAATLASGSMPAWAQRSPPAQSSGTAAPAASWPSPRPRLRAGSKEQLARERHQSRGTAKLKFSGARKQERAGRAQQAPTPTHLPGTGWRCRSTARQSLLPTAPQPRRTCTHTREGRQVGRGCWPRAPCALLPPAPAALPAHRRAAQHAPSSRQLPSGAARRAPCHDLGVGQETSAVAASVAPPAKFGRGGIGMGWAGATTQAHARGGTSAVLAHRAWQTAILPANAHAQVRPHPVGREVGGIQRVHQPPMRLLPFFVCMGQGRARRRHASAPQCSLAACAQMQVQQRSAWCAARTRGPDQRRALGAVAGQPQRCSWGCRKHQPLAAQKVRDLVTRPQCWR